LSVYSVIRVRELKAQKIDPVHMPRPGRFHELFDNMPPVSDGKEVTV
jgi:hypothetical protein